MEEVLEEKRNVRGAEAEDLVLDEGEERSIGSDEIRREEGEVTRPEDEGDFHEGGGITSARTPILSTVELRRTKCRQLMSLHAESSCRKYSSRRNDHLPRL